MTLVEPTEWAEILFYNERTGRLFWRPKEEKNRHDKRRNTLFAGKEAGTPVLGYKSVLYRGKKYLAHRVVWAIVYGEYPRFFIDHINGDRSDNRIANLRDVTQQENQRNVALLRNNTSGVMGVSWSEKDKRWTAEINGPKGPMKIGRFKEKSDAVFARKAAEVELGYHPNHGRPRA
jgi:hypothetical protein